MAYFINLEVFLRRKLKTYFAVSDIKSLRNKKFVIVSNNCFGGQAYQWLKLSYNTPFVGMFLYGPCYIKLLQNFDHYMLQDLKFVSETKYPDRPKTYPVALLDDIELHFSHYKTEEEAQEKWYRRRARLLSESNKDNFFFVICDRERVDAKIIEKFHQLEFKNKLSFAVFDIEGLSKTQHVNVFKKFNRHKRRTPNGKKMFKISFLYIDFVKWLNTNTVKRTRFKG